MTTDISTHKEQPSEDAERNGTQFSSRWAFWVSAIGCSVGFGNLWRFPYLVYDYGGLAFFVPYLAALFLVVIPISMLEFGLGQLSQGGTVKAYRSIHSRAAGAGWCFLICANVLVYYPLLLAWSLIYFANSFKRDLPWISVGDPSRSTFKAVTFFEQNVSAKPDYWEGIQGFNGYILLGEFISWSCVCLATVGGARILGYINYFITCAPAVFLIILVGVGASLDGAGNGVRAYIGHFNGSTLQNAAVWAAACGQALFSMGATQGTMVAYSSHNKRDQNFVQDTYVVAFGDTLFAIIAGFAVFTVVGYMSFVTNIPIPDLPLSGPGLAFQTYPVGLGSAIPYPWAQILSVMFFLTLWLLGMSTSVGIVEAICCPLIESRLYSRLPRLKRWHCYVAVCSVLFLFAFLFSTDMGYHLLTALDHLLNNITFIFVAGCEASVAGWLSAWDLYKRRAGTLSVYIHVSTFFTGAILGPLIGFITPSEIGRIIGPVVGGLVIIAGFITALAVSRDDDAHTGLRYTFKDRVYNLSLYNIGKLRQCMNETACRNTIFRIPRIWCVLMKYVIPLVTSILLFSVITNPYSMYKLPTEPGSSLPPYQWWVLLFGSVGPYVVVGGILLFIMFPQLMYWLWPVNEVILDYGDEFEVDTLAHERYKVQTLYKSASSNDNVGVTGPAESTP